MEIVAIGLVLCFVFLIGIIVDLDRDLKDKDNVLKVRDGHIEELKQAGLVQSSELRDARSERLKLEGKLDDAQAELIKYLPRRGAGGKFVGKA